MTPQLPFDSASLLARFPTVTFAMAYGSGIIPRPGYEKERPQLDFVFAVASPKEWHQENLQRNPSDYSALRFLGSRIISTVQRKGARVYYNPTVSWQDRQIKYGVIAEADLLKDLQEWETLYVAGRMQKPFVAMQHNFAVDQAKERNLEYAVHAALLLLPEKFSQKELYFTLAGISYQGDTRMKFGENPKKVENLVAGKEEEFWKLYCIALSKVQSLHFFPEGILEQDKSVEAQKALYDQLPASMKTLWPLHLLSEEMVRKGITKSIHRIVAASSTAQTIKGFFTAGVKKSLQYGWAKVKKARRKK